MFDKYEQQAIDDIKKYGCYILQVLEENELPPFSYSIGIATTYQKPDLCVIGLKEPIAKCVINEYALMLKNGKIFEPGKLYSGFLDGFDVCFENITEENYEDYFGQGIRYYKGLQFTMMQLIYPTTSGIYPWSKEAPKDFLEWQPILTKDHKTSFHTK
jgi:hypothetical protein